MKTLFEDIVDLLEFADTSFNKPKYRIVATIDGQDEVVGTYDSKELADAALVVFEADPTYVEAEIQVDPEGLGEWTLLYPIFEADLTEKKKKKKSSKSRSKGGFGYGGGVYGWRGGDNDDFSGGDGGDGGGGE